MSRIKDYWLCLTLGENISEVCLGMKLCISIPIFILICYLIYVTALYYSTQNCYILPQPNLRNFRIFTYKLTRGRMNTILNSKMHLKLETTSLNKLIFMDVLRIVTIAWSSTWKVKPPLSLVLLAFYTPFEESRVVNSAHPRLVASWVTHAATSVLDAGLMACHWQRCA